ncbi:MAG: sugar ABC transporter permease, partial [Clostridiales bacterium]|nr:sugar ABC transporter permease [Clostridiales bacterium]
IIDTYVYRVGISQARFSYAAAAGVFKAVINFALLMGANMLADRLGESALF